MVWFLSVNYSRLFQHYFMVIRDVFAYFRQQDLFSTFNKVKVVHNRPILYCPFLLIFGTKLVFQLKRRIVEEMSRSLYIVIPI